VRPGADDNASGVAAVIVLARALRALPVRRCAYLFIATSGEEFGFQGSKYFVKHPTVRPDSIALVLNFDQIGFVRNGKAMVLGATTSPPIASAVQTAETRNPGIKLVYIPVTSRTRWSDQAAFARAGIDTLFFYAGRTRHYHTRTDTADKLNYEGCERLVTMAFEIIRGADETLSPGTGPAQADEPALQSDKRQPSSGHDAPL
jgi:Zn-dependent M28 family amino/carboxypeptidase